MAGAYIFHQFNERKVMGESLAHLVFGLWLGACLFACSCATPYKPLKHRYGYSERQVESDVYEVSFLGNGNSSYEMVLDFAMLRTAEIALNHQAKSFILLDLVSLSSLRKYLTPTHFYQTASPYLGPGGQTLFPAAGLIDWSEWSYLVVEPAQQRTYYRPGVKLKVKLLPDPPGSYYPYDPAKESDRLKRKYGIKPAKR
jgi:hypothetical protein